jgi:undecaprenyl diphosphate synthase
MSREPRIPEHVAIVMDGNGRWAEGQGKPRTAGHRAGVESVRRVMEVCGQAGVKVLTLFAFSSENWKRPKSEVSLLLDLFLVALRQEIRRIDKRNVRLRIVGDLSAFPHKLQQRIIDAEQLTADNDGLLLQIAANYGGRWDITQAARSLARRVQAGELDADAIDEAVMGQAMSFSDVPDPDLFIRTGGEQRISNFLLWQSAYAELYFTDVLWPDFHEVEMRAAMQEFAGRERRFGLTGAQQEASSC